jgi:hypothetical protein
LVSALHPKGPDGVEILAEWRPCPTPSGEPLLNRAHTAYWREPREPGDGTSRRPPPDRAQLAGHDGKRYAVLWIGDRILRVYRVRAYDGILRRMRRYPVALGRALQADRQDRALS